MTNIMNAVLSFAFISLATIASAQDMPTSPGRYELVLAETDNRYTLVIPEGYSENQAVPFVLSLHFGGEVTPFIGGRLLDTLITPALEGLGAIIVAPDNLDGGWTNSSAEEHILKLVDYIQSQYNIDTTKTVLTGVSMGGAGTWYIAPRYSDRFSVAIPISGMPQEDSLSMDWNIPLYIIHSRADEVVDITPTEEAVVTLQERGESVTFVVVSGLSHFQFSNLQPQLKGAIPWIRENWQSRQP